MTTGRAAIFALFALFGFGAENRLSAQPVSPPRPPNSAFGNIFGPGTAVIPNAGTVNNIPRAGGNVGPGGLVTPGLGTGTFYGPFTPYVLSMQPVVFNNRGHWYSNYYGHWYQNGLTSGVGVLSNGGNASGYNRLASAAGLMNNSAFGVGPLTGVGMPGAGLPAAGPGIGQPGAGLPQAMPGAIPVIGAPGFPR